MSVSPSEAWIPKCTGVEVSSSIGLTKVIFNLIDLDREIGLV